MTEDMARSATISDDRILECLNDTTDPVRTAPDLAEELPLGVDGIRHRLKQLEEDGRVRSKSVGARATVWWRQR